MNNVIRLNVPPRMKSREQKIIGLAENFAAQRHPVESVFWMKENAELLNILESTAQQVPSNLLDLYEAFYRSAEQRMTFFPQYYRFFLSILADLESLGMQGDMASKMAGFAVREGLPEAELSDLQRAEAIRLVTRTGVKCDRDPDLNDRLHAFANRCKTFKLPNKKAAYELTHIVFYLSEYGRNSPSLDQAAVDSLQFAGITAFLDQDADLLSEVCIALTFAGSQPPRAWTDWLCQQTSSAFEFVDRTGGAAPDDYHTYLVCNWFQTVSGGQLCDAAVPENGQRILRTGGAGTALGELSRVMLEMGDSRCADWARMERHITSHLSEAARDVVQMAVQSSSQFETYFDGFARAGHA